MIIMGDLSRKIYKYVYIWKILKKYSTMFGN